jgi:FkbM family methyltransferase
MTAFSPLALFFFAFMLGVVVREIFPSRTPAPLLPPASLPGEASGLLRADTFAAPSPTAKAAARMVPASSTKFIFPPHIKRIIINVGSWLTPPLSTADDMAVLAVEPNLNTVQNIRKDHNGKNLWVVCTAISVKAGFENFFTYNTHGASSSLTEMKDKTTFWSKDSARENGYDPITFVPALSMQQLLDAIPEEIDIIGMKTDMQGWDYLAIESIGTGLRRVRELVSEVTCHGFSYNPDAPDNDYDSVWKEHMGKPELGFTLAPGENTACWENKPAETNAHWIRNDYLNGERTQWWGDLRRR